MIKKKPQPTQWATKINININLTIFIAPAYLKRAKNFNNRPNRNNRGNFNSRNACLYFAEEEVSPSVSGKK